jgi:C4-dicarboxylate transporter DctM subunit
MLDIDPAFVGLASLGGMLVLLALGVPVGVSLGISGFAGLLLTTGWDAALSQVYNLPYNTTAQYVFAVVPLFILMGNLAVTAGIARELYEAADKLFGRLPGGLYITTIGGSTAFGALSGSSIVNSTVFTRIALPEMIRRGYSKSFSAACIASVGTLDAMIPPSIVMVIYGIICEVSIGKLFMAGIIPGLMAAGMYVVFVWLMVYLKPSLAPARRDPVGWGEKLRALSGVWIVIVVFFIMMGGLYLGVFAPSAAGAVGAFSMLAVVLLRRKLTAKGLWEALESAALVTAMLFVIIIGGMLFSRMLLFSGFVTTLVDLVRAINLSPLALLLMLSLMYIILGTFLDAVSMMVVTLPFVYPIVIATNIDPIWFGIIVVQLVEIGAITPPVGLNLFATVSAGGGLVNMTDLIRGILPFVILNLFILAIIIAFPQLALWLPATMLGS